METLNMRTANRARASKHPEIREGHKDIYQKESWAPHGRSWGQEAGRRGRALGRAASVVKFESWQHVSPAPRMNYFFKCPFSTWVWHKTQLT